jgi:trehalose 6-phosphate phosphatase
MHWCGEDRWHKGEAVLHLLQTLDLDADDACRRTSGPIAWDTFRALAGRGVGTIVGHPEDPEVVNRPTATELVLEFTVEVE